MTKLTFALLATLALAGSADAQTRSERAPATSGQVRYTAMSDTATRSPGQASSHTRAPDTSAPISVWEHRLHSANQ